MSSELLRIAKEEIRRCTEIFKREFGFVPRVDEIKFSNAMTRTWGRAEWLSHPKFPTKTTIKLSAKVFKADSKAFRNTVVHEFAHIADFWMTGKMDHGENWERLMRMFGQQPNKTVTKKEIEEVGFVRERRKMTKYVFKCGCQEHLISGQRFDAARKGYFECVLCNEIIKFTNVKVKV